MSGRVPQLWTEDQVELGEPPSIPRYIQIMLQDISQYRSYMGSVRWQERLEGCMRAGPSILPLIGQQLQSLGMAVTKLIHFSIIIDSRYSLTTHLVCRTTGLSLVSRPSYV